MIPLQPITKPAIPFVDDIINGLQVGNVISIHGLVPHVAQSFTINLACGPNSGGEFRSPIAFHFNPRFNQRYVARNSYVNNSWQSEESDSPFGGFPFQRGENFEILILVKSHDYKVAVNNKHFISFSHRIPIESVKTIHILGDIVVDRVFLSHEATVPFSPPSHISPISFTHVPFSPPSHAPTGPTVFYNLHVPVEKHIPERMQVGKKIVVSGHPTSRPHRFTVDLLNGNDEIAFHFDVRFDERCVVRNTKVKGHWGAEERHTFKFPFYPSTTFDIKITCDHDRYIVDVDGSHFCVFTHKLPYTQVSKVGISGDVFIKSLIIH